jgi:hypothetical protein
VEREDESSAGEVRPNAPPREGAKSMAAVVFPIISEFVVGRGWRRDEESEGGGAGADFWAWWLLHKEMDIWR